MLLADFVRLSPLVRGQVVDGLSAAIDTVAGDAPESHRFLRYQWFAAGIAAHGGAARTIVIESDNQPVIALPLAEISGTARLAAIPGGCAPFRSFPVSPMADAACYAALIEQIGQTANGLRIGPVAADDPAVAPLLETARARGWGIVDRAVETGGGEDDAFWRGLISDPVLLKMLPALKMQKAAHDLREWLLLKPGIPALLGRLLLGVRGRAFS